MKTIALLLAFASSLIAAETRQVEVSFYCLRYAPGAETIHVPQGEGRTSVRLSTANLTIPVQATAVDGVVPVFQQADQPALAGKIRIPAEISTALVVLVPSAPGDAEPYRALVLDRSDKFRLGTYRVVNFSRHPIRGAIGRSFIEANSGGVEELELQGAPGSVQGVKFEFFEQGRWNRLTETRCAVRKDRRWLLCAYEDPKTQRILMRSIPDRTPLVAVADEAATASVN